MESPRRRPAVCTAPRGQRGLAGGSAERKAQVSRIPGLPAPALSPRLVSQPTGNTPTSGRRQCICPQALRLQQEGDPPADRLEAWLAALR